MVDMAPSRQSATNQLKWAIQNMERNLINYKSLLRLLEDCEPLDTNTEAALYDLVSRINWR